MEFVLDSDLLKKDLDQESVSRARPPAVLLVEPFYGGSHKQLVDLLAREIPGCLLCCLSAKKWHWRMRTSALYFSQKIPRGGNFKVLFASSVLNLAELVALRTDLAPLKKLLYFHENQLIYPVRKQQDRDFQYGYNQILSCLVADVVIFNSNFNMESFLSSINSFLKLMPDYRPKGLSEVIRPKCMVLYFPLMSDSQISEALPMKDSYTQGEKLVSNLEQENFTEETTIAKISSVEMGLWPSSVLELSRPLHIVWAHRWEHDKGPDLFFHVLYQLADQAFHFKVSVIGQTFTVVPGVFHEAYTRISDHILHWGYQQTRQEYIAVLKTADVAVSTAEHEFFGVSMLEAVQYECYPLCPNKLVYPEIFPSEYLYSTPQQLLKKLRYFCRNPQHVRARRLTVDWRRFCWDKLKRQYFELFSAEETKTDQN